MGAELVFVLVCITLCLFAIILTGKRELVFAFIVFQMSCYGKCSVALSHGAVGWSAVCDCGIS